LKERQRLVVLMPIAAATASWDRPRVVMTVRTKAAINSGLMERSCMCKTVACLNRPCKRKDSMRTIDLVSTRGRKAGPVSKALGRAIWDVAREAGFTTKTALAVSAGLPEPTLNQITNGRRVADPEQLARIAQALGTRGSVIMARAEAILDTEPGEG
jgi:hypothetical protein